VRIRLRLPGGRGGEAFVIVLVLGLVAVAPMPAGVKELCVTPRIAWGWFARH
jgi:uncharacterized protein HemY